VISSFQFVARPFNVLRNVWSRSFFFARAVSCSLVLSSGAFAESPSITLRWVMPSEDTARPYVELNGLPTGDSLRLRAPNPSLLRWSNILVVYAVPADPPPKGEFASMPGSYRIKPGIVLFMPQDRILPGVVYRAVFYPDRFDSSRPPAAASISVDFQLPAKRSATDATPGRK
jgi:hypothetical protein